MNKTTDLRYLPVWHTVAQSFLVVLRALGDRHFFLLALIAVLTPPLLFAIVRLLEYAVGFRGEGTFAHLFAMLGLLYTAVGIFRAWVLALLGAKDALRWQEGLVPGRGTGASALLLGIVGLTTAMCSFYVVDIISTPEADFPLVERIVIAVVPTALALLLVATASARWCLRPGARLSGLGQTLGELWSGTRGNTWRIAAALWIISASWLILLAGLGVFLEWVGPPLMAPLQSPSPMHSPGVAFTDALLVLRLPVLVLPGVILLASFVAIACRDLSREIRVAAVFD